MKIHILISLILTSSVFVVNAQIYTPNGAIQGPSNSNNVGIGNSNPQSALHIFGNQNLVWSDIYTDNKAGTGLVTIGDKGGHGSLFINTQGVNSINPTGLGIDGDYDSNARRSVLNIKAFGTKYPFYVSSLAFHTSAGTSIAPICSNRHHRLLFHAASRN